MKTVIIAGSGCNSIGWEPIEKAIAACFKSGPPSTLLQPTYYFSLLSFQLRTQKRMVDLLVNSSELEEHLKVLKEKINLRDRIITNISNNIKDGVNDAKIRKIRDPLINEILHDQNNVWLTLNWDDIIERHFHPKEVIHIHGDASNPSTMLLPTEVVLIDYWMFEKDELKYLNDKAYSSLQHLKTAERLVIWGFSLDTYDAEIQVMLAEAVRYGRKLKELFVVDKCEGPVPKAEFLTGCKANHIKPDSKSSKAMEFWRKYCSPLKCSFNQKGLCI